LGASFIAKVGKMGRWWLPPNPGCDESCDMCLPMVHPCTKNVPTMH